MSDIKSFEDWQGVLPKKCDICKAPIEDTFYDGRTVSDVGLGHWAIMCPSCHECVGVGLGTGKGQVYLKGSKADILYKGKDYDSSVKECNEGRYEDEG